MTQKQYAKLVKQISPPSPVGKDCLLAFLVGGLICTLGQGLTELYASALDKQSAATAASMTLVALSALLTGLSLYDDIAKAQHPFAQHRQGHGEGFQHCFHLLTGP